MQNVELKAKLYGEIQELDKEVQERHKTLTIRLSRLETLREIYNYLDVPEVFETVQVEYKLKPKKSKTTKRKSRRKEPVRPEAPAGIQYAGNVPSKKDVYEYCRIAAAKTTGLLPSARQMATKLHTNRAVVASRLRDLEKDNLIYREGTCRWTKWYLKARVDARETLQKEAEENLPFFHNTNE